jgi:hypothetical protein
MGFLEVIAHAKIRDPDRLDSRSCVLDDSDLVSVPMPELEDALGPAQLGRADVITVLASLGQ